MKPFSGVRTKRKVFRGQIVSIGSVLAGRLIRNRQAVLAGIADSSDDPELEELKQKARRLGQNPD